MEIYDKAISYTEKFVSFNTYELEGKFEILKYVEKEIRENTDAEVAIYTDKTETPYMIAYLKAEKSEFTLMLEGHLDVVTPEHMVIPPFTAEIKNGRMYGRGTCDMKAGCSAILVAFLEAAKTKDRTGDLYLVFTTDEEYSGNQILEVMQKKQIPHCDFAMVAEPSANAICTAHKGNAWVDVDFYGKEAHASAPELGLNSIYPACAFISAFQKYTEELYATQEDAIYGKPTMNIGMIDGGTQPNIVPAYTKVHIDKRYLPSNDGMEKFLGEIETVLHETMKEYPKIKTKVIEIVDCSSVMIERDNEILLKVKSVIDEINQKDVPFSMFSGWGEGGYMNKYGIPVVYYGPGSILEAHTKDESCDIEEIKQVTKEYCAIVKALCF